MNSFSATVPKSKADYVAQRLLERIITADLEPGTTFGTEADLLQQFDVSRPTLRESLRILEAQGVLELRPGPRGGIIVTRPGADVLAHGLSVYLRLHEVPFISVLKARELIEPTLAGLAAEYATEEELDALQASVERMKTLKDQLAFIEENRVFHSIIAKASRNEVMEIFWTTISILAHGEHHGISYSAKNQQAVVEAHQGIVDALRARDAARSSELMDAHVRELEMLVRKRYKHLLEQATTIVARKGRRLD